MTFAHAVRRARDPSLPLPHRRLALRAALTAYASLARASFVALHADLAARAGFDGPPTEAQLLAALDLLEADRRDRVTSLAAFATLRRAEKAAGRRQPYRDQLDDFLAGRAWPARRAALLAEAEAFVAAATTDDLVRRCRELLAPGATVSAASGGLELRGVTLQGEPGAWYARGATAREAAESLFRNVWRGERVDAALPPPLRSERALRERQTIAALQAYRARTGATLLEARIALRA